MYILGQSKQTDGKTDEKTQKGLFKISGFIFKKQEIISFCVFILAILFSFYRSKGRLEKLNELLSNKFFTISLFFIVCFSIYTLFLNKQPENKRLSIATKHAIIGFTIGILHHFDFNAAPFWIIWLTSYYLNMAE
jgi:hypothetical protein